MENPDRWHLALCALRLGIKAKPRQMDLREQEQKPAGERSS
jgi:hypothetical protein